MGFELHFTSDFQKNRFLRSQVCRSAPSETALENSGPGASDVGLNVDIEPLGALFITFGVTELLQNLKKITRIIRKIDL